MVDRSELLNDPETAIRLALEGAQSRIFTSFPAIVESVNWAEMTCEVQPAIQGEVTDETGKTQYVNLPVLADCPIQFPSAGGFSITLPVQPGDEVLVHIANRCIDSWWESGAVSVPAEFRMHDLSDGFVVPGIKSKPNVIANISPTDLQIRNDAGTSFIGMKPSGEIDLVSASGVNVTGNLNVSGAVAALGGVTGASGLSLATHKHTGVTAGSSTSGPATP